MGKVVFENVYKTYPPRDKGGDPTTVLRRIDLTVEDGEFLVLVGPSGCGKSTLLRSIAGLEEITGGSIFVGDRRVNELPPKARNIAMVFQSYALYPHLSVYDNLAFGLRRMPTLSTEQGEEYLLATSPGKNILDRTLVGLTRRLPKGMRYVSEQEKSVAAAVKRVAKLLQIEQLLHRLPKELSGGQKQRVALGRAIIRNPAAFLMDEPLSNLDAKLRTETRGQIVELQRQLKTTTIYVTHDQVEAMTMGDRIAVMQAGQIQQIASPLELYRQPANRFVAGFIGSPTMNFVDVELVEEGGTLLAKADGFEVALTEERKHSLNGTKDRNAILGVRPSSFEESDGEGSIMLPILFSEYVGAQSVLISEVGAATIQLEVSTPAPIPSGTERSFRIKTDEIHLFDPQTEAAI
ncbi:MAG: ATP-binding cassette domain-containing protein [Cyanobacteria bacterium P01_F01_bin.153]